MDENLSFIEPGEPLPYEDDVWRIALSTSRDKKNKQEPGISNFSLNSSDFGKLSVEWASMSTPEESVARFGATYKSGTEDFKDYRTRELYALNVGFLRSLEPVEDVLYNPIMVRPVLKGRPDNPAHSLVIIKSNFAQDEPELYKKMRDHAKGRKVEVNAEEVEQLVAIYRKQWD